ncbi:MAG: prephenate dehydrogenase, partial [Dictyoglomus sp.]
MKIGIIGLGLIGTSLGLSFRNSYENLLLWGIDKDDKVLNYLSSKKIFDLLAKEIDEISDEINTSDLIFIAVYPSKVIEVLKVLKSYLGSSTTIVTDTASTKGKIMDWVNGDDFWNGVFIGGHPLAGREISGPEGALEDLFKGKIYFLIPARNVPLEKVNILKRIIKDIGALPYLLSSERHDMILAYTSHLPQIVSYLLAYTSIKEDFLDFLG